MISVQLCSFAYETYTYLVTILVIVAPSVMNCALVYQSSENSPFHRPKVIFLVHRATRIFAILVHFIYIAYDAKRSAGEQLAG
jgi:hypothetical protein